jgi:hypothetical protein
MCFLQDHLQIVQFIDKKTNITEFGMLQLLLKKTIFYELAGFKDLLGVGFVVNV